MQPLEDELGGGSRHRFLKRQLADADITSQMQETSGQEDQPTLRQECLAEQYSLGVTNYSFTPVSTEYNRPPGPWEEEEENSYQENSVPLLARNDLPGQEYTPDGYGWNWQGDVEPRMSEDLSTSPEDSNWDWKLETTGNFAQNCNDPLFNGMQDLEEKGYLSGTLGDLPYILEQEADGIDPDAIDELQF